jgi:hypothetical protein
MIGEDDYSFLCNVLRQLHPQERLTFSQRVFEALQAIPDPHGKGSGSRRLIGPGCRAGGAKGGAGNFASAGFPGAPRASYTVTPTRYPERVASDASCRSHGYPTS